MNLRHFILIFILILSSQGWTQLKEPTSDPAFNEPTPPTTDDMDDAADVRLRPSPVNVVEKDSEKDEDAKVVEEDETPATKFSVTRVRIESNKTSSRSIQLLSPRHNATYTPGVIIFTWKFLSSSKKKRSVVLKVERLDGKKKYSRKMSKEKKLLDLSPGDYKWQVAGEKSTQDTKWRLFKVIGMKSHSVTDLYNGKAPEAKKPSTKKTLPVVSDYIIDLDGPDEDEVRIPASSSSSPTTEQAPLAAPSWTEHNPQ